MMPPSPPLAYHLVTTGAELEKIAGTIRRESRIAVDLEADSMFHFEEKVCLIQLSAGSQSFIIDPLVVTDLSPLSPVFSDSGILKIFHGADYDIRSLYRDFGMDIQNLFDTQIAARFLGETETSLEALLQKRFDVRLDKRYQKKDWSARPLPDEMIEYAAADAFYLPMLADELMQELKDRGRLAWVREECELLSRVRTATGNGEPLFLRFKGAGRLRPRELAVLEALLEFRKDTARKKDRPVYKVIGNHSLLTLATTCPLSMDGLHGSGILSKKQVQMYGSSLIEVIRGALDLPESALPQYPRKKIQRIDPSVSNRVKALKSWRDRRAEALDIDPSIICTKAQLSAVAALNPRTVEALEDVHELKQWQIREFAAEFIAALCPKKRRKPSAQKLSA
jgi:ribonuclease D